MSRSEAHEKNIPHIICRIFAFTPDEYYLVQRRAEDRKAHPGLYTDSASGHIQYNPDFSYEYIEKEAWRELAEEMGAKLIYGRLLDLNLEEFRSGGCELSYNFVALIEKYCRPDPVETAPESGFRSSKEMELLLESVNFVKTTKKYWQLIISQHYCAQLLHEREKNHHINKDLRDYQIHQTGPQVDEDEVLKSINKISQNAEIAKNPIIGALVGRFQPLHNGHLKLIQKILFEVDYLKIGVGSAQYSNDIDNPFTYQERAQMINAALDDVGISRDRYSISPIMDLHDMVRWTSEVIRVLGDFDIFYSNNEWTRQLLQKAGKKVGDLMQFDFKKYNGTAIRHLIHQNRSITDRIPPKVNEILEKIDGFSRIRSFLNQADA